MNLKAARPGSKAAAILNHVISLISSIKCVSVERKGFKQ